MRAECLRRIDEQICSRHRAAGDDDNWYRRIVCDGIRRRRSAHSEKTEPLAESQPLQ